MKNALFSKSRPILKNFTKGGHLQLADSFFAPTVSANWREYCNLKLLRNNQLDRELLYLPIGPKIHLKSSPPPKFSYLLSLKNARTNCL